MPKKKKLETSTSTPVDVDKIVEPEPVEKLILVRAKRSLQDGVFKADFNKYGYKLYWQEGEIRAIPDPLFVKLNLRSGGSFEKIHFD